MNPTVLLTIATLALVVGPMLERLGRRLPAVAAMIDGLTVGGIVTISLFELMPEAGAHLGWWALVLFVLGLCLPLAAERALVKSSSLRTSVGVLVLLLFVAHVVIEGAALVSKSYDERLGLATLVVVVGHRLPLAALLWGQASRRFGRAIAMATLAGVAALTWFGPMVIPNEQGELTAALSALLAGGLLHLVLQHRPHLDETRMGPRATNAWATLGVLAAVFLLLSHLWGGEAGHDHGSANLPSRLYALVLEVSFPLLIGVLGAALIEAFMPPSAARWLSSGSRLRQSLRGVAIGAPMPVCSCGVLPIYRSLIQKGVPPAAALSLLIAAPEIGIDSFLLSWPLLGPSTTFARLACALVLALSVGWFVGGFRRETGAKTACPEHGSGQGSESGGGDPGEPPPPSLAPAQAIRRGLLETWGHLGPWILMGLVATAMVEPWISTEWSRLLPPWAQVLVLSLAGMPMYICATAATPFAALLLIKGFAPGAVIAFLLTGPATNLTTFGALRRLHSRRMALGFVLTALAATWGLGLVVNQLGLELPTQLAALEPHAEHSALEQVSALLLLVLTLWVLFREGPRTFLAQLWPEGAHDHGDHQGHSHGTGHTH